ncbi:MAG TPA: alkane 1-monooxygenase [Burkholderiales bacterium]|nr:alkane 1-monooxygenase [Burkholderiales bacterium]
MSTGLRKYRFLLALTLPTMPVAGYLIGNNFYTLIVGIVVIGLLDFVVGRDRRNPRPETLPALEEDRFYRAILYTCAVLDLLLIAWGAMISARGGVSPVQSFGLMLSVGFVTGAQGITFAHELGHARSRLDRLLAKVLLTAVCYGHFFIEHNRGHHVRVATPEDPASARFGESFYAFYPRTVAFSWLHAWRLEAERLARRGARFFGWRNQMLWFTALPALIAGGLWRAWGPAAALFFVVQSWMAFTLLEAVNYVQHYGLARRRLDDGSYERVGHGHSWNASETLTNCFLIHLQRHSDHHEIPARAYQALLHHDDGPQLPTGYSGMLPLALVPPLWFAVMNRRLPGFR